MQPPVGEREAERQADNRREEYLNWRAADDKWYERRKEKDRERAQLKQGKESMEGSHGSRRQGYRLSGPKESQEVQDTSPTEKGKNKDRKRDGKSEKKEVKGETKSDQKEERQQEIGEVSRKKIGTGSKGKNMPEKSPKNKIPKEEKEKSNVPKSPEEKSLLENYDKSPKERSLASNKPKEDQSQEGEEEAQESFLEEGSEWAAAKQISLFDKRRYRVGDIDRRATSTLPTATGY